MRIIVKVTAGFGMIIAAVAASITFGNMMFGWNVGAMYGPLFGDMMFRQNFAAMNGILFILSLLFGLVSGAVFVIMGYIAEKRPVGPEKKVEEIHAVAA
jgi:hypothetical protein